MANQSHKTAISRNKLSAPMCHLNEHSLLKKRALDFGCGRGQDADRLGIDKYDPHWHNEPLSGLYETITCNFVLNVIPGDLERRAVLSKIKTYLAPGGIAYISVRNDKAALKGWTKRGTWQGFIELDLPVVKRSSSFVMYELKSGKAGENDEY